MSGERARTRASLAARPANRRARACYSLPKSLAPAPVNAPSPTLLAYPFPAPPAPGALLTVAPGVAWLRMPLPFALDHINLCLLDDDDGYTIVDTGYGVERTRDLWEIVFVTLPSGRPVRRVIVTHYHPDHVGCADWLCQRWDVELWMTEAEFLSAHAVREGVAGYGTKVMQNHFRHHGLDEERLKAQETRGNAYSDLVHSHLSLCRICCCCRIEKSAYLGSFFR